MIVEKERASKSLGEASACAMYKLLVFQKAKDSLEKRGRTPDIQSLGKIVDDVLNIDLLRHLLIVSQEAQEAQTRKVVDEIVQRYLRSRN
jgi:hypothetical protein